ncbi:MAG: hypothetical protein GC146_00485 [Limimaricola sp.]|uniref:hypothetical protein n=1 Tax=Limimaricola sp. TaxID=2211665 RepID=UPI001D646852|nr:hypothetical protein [Limimaricola sp.]MBI1415678.1 hypothetical protein [Limimaricola sp.]
MPVQHRAARAAVFGVVLMLVPVLAAADDDPTITTQDKTIAVHVPAMVDLVLPRPAWAPDGYDAHPYTDAEPWQNIYVDEGSTDIYAPITSEEGENRSRPVITLTYRLSAYGGPFATDESDYAPRYCWGSEDTYTEERAPLAGQDTPMLIVVCGAATSGGGFAALIGTSAAGSSKYMMLEDAVMVDDGFDIADRTSWPVSLDDLRARADAYHAVFAVK